MAKYLYLWNKINLTSEEEEIKKYLTRNQYHLFIGEDGNKARIVFDNTIDDGSYKKIEEKINDPFIIGIRSFLDYKDLCEQFYLKQPIYYDKSNIWWLWNFKEHKWEMVDDIDIMNNIDYALRFTAINTIKNKAKQEIIEALKRIGRKNKPKIPSKNWIQFKNYVYDIETEQKFKPTPEYFFVNPIPHNISNDDSTPVIDKLFTEWVNDRKQLLYEVMAYCLYSEYPIHRLFCLHGRGRNGKSKYLELIRRIIGQENCTSTELDILTSNRFESAKLYKKLVCLMSETNYSTLKSTSLLKKLVGQDFIGYEFKNKMPFDDYNYAKLLIATNSVPNTTDKSDGYYGRWILIEFANRFSEGRDILADILPFEYENLCLKLVKILKQLLLKGEFTGEGTIEHKKKIYEEKSNPLTKFLSEKTIKNFEGFIYKRMFKDAVDSWMKENGYGYSLSDMDISSQMKGNYEEHKKGSGDTRYWAWCGLSWKVDILIEESVNPVNPVNPLSISTTTLGTKLNTLDTLDTLDKSIKNIYWDSNLIEYCRCQFSGCINNECNDLAISPTVVKKLCKYHFDDFVNKNKIIQNNSKDMS